MAACYGLPMWRQGLVLAVAFVACTRSAPSPATARQGPSEIPTSTNEAAKWRSAYGTCMSQLAAARQSSPPSNSREPLPTAQRPSPKAPVRAIRKPTTTRLPLEQCAGLQGRKLSSCIRTGVVPETKEWWCTSSARLDDSFCEEFQDECETFAQKSVLYGECSRQPYVACFDLYHVLHDATIPRCSKILSQCDSEREELLKQTRDYRVLSECTQR